MCHHIFGLPFRRFNFTDTPNMSRNSKKFKIVPKSLSPETIASLTEEYPPLVPEEFRFSLIRKGYKPPADDGSILLITPTKANPDYALLSSSTHKCYVKHRISDISNQAPTIEQWFQELRVYPDELDLPAIPARKSKDLFKAHPKPTFFRDADINFASSKNARGKKHPGWFVYYYYVEPVTYQVLHLDEPEARQLYCKKYEQSIMFDKSPAKPVFECLWRKCMTRSRSIPIVLRGHGITESLDRHLSIPDLYHDYHHCFPFIYCLAEMLLKFPHLDQCIWNREVAPKSIPIFHSDPRPRKMVSYTDPHIGKVYASDTKTQASSTKPPSRTRKSSDNEDEAPDISDIASFITE